jgi:hypothetical protein
MIFKDTVHHQRNSARFYQASGGFHETIDRQ